MFPRSSRCQDGQDLNALSEAGQREFKDEPYNLRVGCAKGALLVRSPLLLVNAGGVHFGGPGFKLVVDGIPLLALRRDHEQRLLISVELRDEADSVLARIRDNEWVLGDPQPWDFEYKYNWVLLRERKGRRSLEIDARSDPVQLQGFLQMNGQSFELRPEALILNGVVEYVTFAELGLVAIQMEMDTGSGELKLNKIPPFPRGSFVPASPETMMARCLEEYRNLLSEMDLSRNDPCPCQSGLKVKKCCLSRDSV